MEDIQITIKNLRYRKPTESYQVRVDRTSVLGNPFFLTDKNSQSERNYICDCYDWYFRDKIKKDEKIQKEIERLKYIAIKYRKLELFCWCAPLRCHAETIKNYLEEEVRKMSNDGGKL